MKIDDEIRYIFFNMNKIKESNICTRKKINPMQFRVGTEGITPYRVLQYKSRGT